MAAVRVPYLLGHTEIAELFGVKRQTSQKWRTDGTLPPPDLLASGNPYWLLSTVLQFSEASTRPIPPDHIVAYRQRFPHGYDVEAREQLPFIVGIKEVSLLLGRDEKTVARWRSRDQIAPEDLIVSGSPLWLLNSIVADSGSRGRRLDERQLELLRGGKRPVQQPRGRRTTSSTPRPTRSPVPKSRTFAPEDREAAVAFLDALVADGLAVTIRPKRERP